MSDGGICCGNLGWMGRVAWFVGETARPMSMAIIGTSTAAGFLMRLDTGALGVMSALMGTLYGAKVVERMQAAKVEADGKKNGSTG